ncbi:MAG: hypothetical protein M1818_000718 [Claussenomyces sp. TS43310]|nr:MAG: hypothetical protein M1818_000718 [Claussenomyces sp. TS43310]
MSLPPQIPATPRVISPSPTPSDSGSQDVYFGPVTRSAAKKRLGAPMPIDEELDGDVDYSNPDVRQARSKSRSPMRVRKTGGLPKVGIDVSAPAKAPDAANGKATNGYLSPTTASKGWSWRDISRSPSPLGLIPIHRKWRVFIHRHEVPRKALHVSIGFFTLWAYISGLQTSSITPWLLGAFIPIASVDLLRFKWPAFNRFYVRVLGALMRETEYDGWNGVIWYLLGVWISLGFLPKDIGVVSVLLLSWCDTAASTFGRAYGRYTPRIRKGKSLAGSLAAMVTGILTALFFWGWLAPKMASTGVDDGNPFMYTGILRLPSIARDALGLTGTQASIGGGVALAIMSLWTGFIASASEVVDLFNWDDNLTIPVLSGIGIWGFLKIFG